VQNISKNYEGIVIKFYGEVGHGQREPIRFWRLDSFVDPGSFSGFFTLLDRSVNCSASQQVVNGFWWNFMRGGSWPKDQSIGF